LGHDADAAQAAVGVVIKVAGLGKVFDIDFERISRCDFTA
jgi:hypothetical protein